MVKRSRTRKQRGGGFRIGDKVVALGVGFGRPARPANQKGTIVGITKQYDQEMYQIRFDNYSYKDELLPEAHLRYQTVPVPGGFVDFGAAAAPTAFGTFGSGGPLSWSALKSHTGSGGAAAGGVSVAPAGSGGLLSGFFGNGGLLSGSALKSYTAPAGSGGLLSGSFGSGGVSSKEHMCRVGDIINDGCMYGTRVLYREAGYPDTRGVYTDSTSDGFKDWYIITLDTGEKIEVSDPSQLIVIGLPGSEAPTGDAAAAGEAPAAPYGFSASGFGAAGSGFGAPARPKPTPKYKVGDVIVFKGLRPDPYRIVGIDFLDDGQIGYLTTLRNRPRDEPAGSYENDIKGYYREPAKAAPAPAAENDGFIRYVISAHGDPSGTHFTPPRNLKLAFFTRDGKNLSCPRPLQTAACTGSEDKQVVEWVNSPTSIRDYDLSLDDKTGENWFYAGAKDCYSGKLVYNLEYESPLRLSALCKIIKDYHLETYGDRPAIVYCLHCRGGKAPTNVIRVTPKGFGGRSRKARKNRKSRKSRKSRR